MLLEQLGRGAGSPFHAVDHDHVGARLGRQPDVVEDPRGPHLDEDRHLVVGRFAQLFDLDDQVVGAEEVGMPAGRALIDAGREVAQPGDLVGDLRAQQQSAGPRLGPLADRQLDGVGLAEVLDVDSVPAGQDLVDHHARLGAFDVEHAAVAGGGRRARQPRPSRQRGLGVLGQRPVAHPGHHQGDLELDRFCREPSAEDSAGGAGLAIAFQRDARERAGDEREVVEGGPGPRPKRAEAADAIPRQLGLDLDVFDDRGGECARRFASARDRRRSIGRSRPRIEPPRRTARRFQVGRSNGVILSSRLG